MTVDALRPSALFHIPSVHSYIHSVLEIQGGDLEAVQKHQIPLNQEIQTTKDPRDTGRVSRLLLRTLRNSFYCNDIKCTKNWTNQRQEGRTLNRSQRESFNKYGRFIWADVWSLWSVLTLHHSDPGHDLGCHYRGTHSVTTLLQSVCPNLPVSVLCVLSWLFIPSPAL